MSSSIMRTAVLQATAIFTISAILGHHLSENMFDQVWEDEGFLNMTSVLNKTTPYASSNHSPSRLISDAGNSTNTTLSLSRTTDISNATAVNGTSAMPKMSVESIYGWRLPREVAIYLVISTLQYYWLIWLERILPARPRRRDVPYQRHEKVEESEDREEEIVQRWIAQGRVKRASLNWCNTFLKWVLELTVGRLWYHSVEHVLRVLVRDGAPRSVFKGMKGHLGFNFIGIYLSFNPLATLVSFIIVPAHKQLVFMAGAELVSSVFFTTLIRIFAVWLVKTDLAQAFMRNVTSNALEGISDGKVSYYQQKNEL